MQTSDFGPKTGNPQLQRLRAAFAKLRVTCCAIYTFHKHDEAIRVRFWGAWSPYFRSVSDYEDARDRYRNSALYAVLANQDRIAAPPPDWKPDERGRVPWTIIVGSGAIREAGYVICAVVFARNEDEARATIESLQELWASHP